MAIKLLPFPNVPEKIHRAILQAQGEEAVRLGRNCNRTNALIKIVTEWEEFRKKENAVFLPANGQ